MDEGRGEENEAGQDTTKCSLHGFPHLNVRKKACAGTVGDAATASSTSMSLSLDMISAWSSTGGALLLSLRSFCDVRFEWNGDKPEADCVRTERARWKGAGHV